MNKRIRQFSLLICLVTFLVALLPLIAYASPEDAAAEDIVLEELSPEQEAFLDFWEKELARANTISVAYTIVWDPYVSQARVRVDYSCYDDKGYALNVDLWGKIVTDSGTDTQTKHVSGTGSFYTYWINYKSSSTVKGSCGQV